MNLTELIRSRRSIGAFTNQPIPEGLVERLLETAIYAPNHRLTEPWRFIYVTGASRDGYADIRRQMALENMTVTDPAERQKAGEGVYQKFASVPAYLVVAMVEVDNPEIREEDYAACACVISNFLLLAWECGLGTSWKTFKNDNRLRALLGLEPVEKVVGIIQLGYPAALPPPTARRPARDRLTRLR
jgi:nitroreductase